MPYQRLPTREQRKAELQDQAVRSLGQEFIYGYPAGYYGAKKLFGAAGETIEAATGLDLPGDPQAVKEQAIKDYAPYAPTRDDLASQFLRGGLSEGLTTSLIAGVPGIAVGALAGASLPATAVAFAVGAGTIFGLAEYTTFMDDYGASLQSKGVSSEVVEQMKKDPEIIKAAAASSTVEGGLEILANTLQMKAASLIGKKALTEPLKRGLKDTAVRLLSNYAKAAPFEVGTEMAQEASGVALRQEVGIETGMTPGQAAIRAIAPALGMTLGFQAGGEVSARLGKPAEVKKLTPEEVKKSAKLISAAANAPTVFEVGQEVEHAGEVHEIIDASDPSLVTLRRKRDQAEFSTGRLSVKTPGEDQKMTRVGLKTRMLSVPQTSSEEADVALILIDARARQLGMDSDSFIQKFFKDWKYEENADYLRQLNGQSQLPQLGMGLSLVAGPMASKREGVGRGEVKEFEDTDLLDSYAEVGILLGNMNKKSVKLDELPEKLKMSPELTEEERNDLVDYLIIKNRHKEVLDEFTSLKEEVEKRGLDTDLTTAMGGYLKRHGKNETVQKRMNGELLFQVSDKQEAVFIGMQENPGGEDFPLFNITKEGHPKNRSTVTIETLREEGLKVPEGFDETEEPLLQVANQPIWFSPLERGILEEFPWGEKAFKTSTTALVQWLGSGNRSEGVRLEAEYTGIVEWLNGRKKVSKAEVEEYIRENTLELRDVLMDWDRTDHISPPKQENEIGIQGYYENYFEILITAPKITPQFSGNELHFGEKNLIGWILATEKIDSEGKRVLFIEEIQSDWMKEKGKKEKVLESHQLKGRSEEDILKAIEDLEAEILSVTKIRDKFILYNFEVKDTQEYINQANELYQRLDVLSNQLISLQAAIKPSTFPFQPDTYHKPIMRRALKYAADHGFDKLAWQKGERIAENYRIEGTDNWATTLYNTRLPKFMKKYVKRFGGEVGKVEFNIDREREATYNQPILLVETEEDAITALESLGRPVTASNISEIIGMYYDTRMNELITEDFRKLEPTMISFNSVSILPSMTQQIPLFQLEESPNGLTEISADGKAIVTIFKDGNVSTVFHELWHIFEKTLTPDEIKTFNKLFSGDGKVQHENSARAFERYLREGKTKHLGLNGIFNKLRDWLLDVYQNVIGSAIDVEFNDEMRAFFDELFVSEVLGTGKVMPLDTLGEEEIENARSGALEAETESKKGKLSGIKWILERLENFVSIEAGWDRVGNAAIGRALKVAAGREELEQERAAKSAEAIEAMLKNDKHLLPMVVLIAEDANQLENLTSEEKELIAPSVKILRDYLDEAKEDLNRRGIMHGGFVESMLKKLSEAHGKALAAGDQEEMTRLEADMLAWEELEFVHIPLAWFFEKMTKDPIGARRVLRYSTVVKRKTGLIADLLNEKDPDGNPLLKAEEISPTDILMSYGRRYGRDVALNEVVRAAATPAEGSKVHAIKYGDPSTPEGKSRRQKLIDGGHWVDPPSRAPALRGYVVSRPLADTLEEQVFYSSRGSWFTKLLSWSKMAQFINPLFLPMYDIVQHTMRFGISIPSALKTVKYLRLAAKHQKEFTDLYQSAKWYGLASKPEASPFSNHQDWIRRIKADSVGKELLETFRGKNFPINPIKGIYTLSWNMAWKLDETVRMASFLRLKEAGYSDQDAAQQAALFHGDYAGVPHKSRKMLNKIFFTPTFKIAMGKLYLRMINGAIDQTVGKGDETSRGYAAGLVWTASIVAGFNGFLMMLGFEPEEWGRRYTKTIETEQGTRELVWTFSNPANMFLKYYYRTQQAFRDDKETPWQRLLINNKWEIHPVWRLLWDVGSNKQPDGQPIYSAFDSTTKKTAKGMWFYLKGIVQLFQIPQQVAESVESFEEKTGETSAREAWVNAVAQDAISKEVAKGISVFEAVFPLSFKYLRKTGSDRAAYQVYTIHKKLRDTARRGQLTEARVRNYQKQVQEILARLE